MPGRATGKYLKVPPRKVRAVADLIRGMPVTEAEQVIRFSRQRAARIIGKVLKSAVASAEQAAPGDTKPLVVARAVVDEGPTQKRLLPRARGVRNLMRRRTSHITIIVDEQ